MLHPCVTAHGSFVKPFGGYHVIRSKTQFGTAKAASDASSTPKGVGLASA